MESTHQSLLDLFLELQALDRIPRMGYSMRGMADPESVSEHSFHLSTLAWGLSMSLPELDRLRVLELALVHDLPEVRTGDLPRTVSRYLPREVKAAAERAVAAELLAPLGDHGPALLDEYQAAETPEARFVSVCDKLQLLIKVAAYEHWGAGGLGEFGEALDRFDDGGFEPVRRLVDELRTWRRDHGLDQRPGAPI